MGTEIERRFLVHGDQWKGLSLPVFCCQGYLNSAAERTVRVRILGDAAFLTVKGLPRNMIRPEYEYPIPLEDARAMLDTLAEQPLIEKNRHTLLFPAEKGLVWVVDEFLGANAGLVIAEVELDRPDQAFTKPPWLGKEITDDPRYLNSSLARRPFQEWGKRID